MQYLVQLDPIVVRSNSRHCSDQKFYMFFKRRSSVWTHYDSPWPDGIVGTFNVGWFEEWMAGGWILESGKMMVKGLGN